MANSNSKIKYVGLDVHAASIVAAVADGDRNGEVRAFPRFQNDLKSLKNFMKKLGPAGKLRVCYEAGPCGYGLYWSLAKLGIECEVIAPSLIPNKPGDRVKTDRRDAEKLARCHRAGELTSVWVPTKEHESLRELVRQRETAKGDLRCSRQRMNSFLLRQGCTYPKATKRWGCMHVQWLNGLTFDSFGLQSVMIDQLAEIKRLEERLVRLDTSIDEGITLAPEHMQEIIRSLQALRGIAKQTAIGVAVELGSFIRFDRPKNLMGYSGMCSSEYSSGESIRRGAISKAGNAHIRRLVVESAWSYRYRPAVQGALKKRQVGLDEEVIAIAWKAQHRLNKRYRQLSAKGKPGSKVVTAVARELLGFIWAIGIKAESKHNQNQIAA